MARPSLLRPSLLRPSLAVAALAIGVYLNTLPAQFTFDDNFAVVSVGAGGGEG